MLCFEVNTKSKQAKSINPFARRVKKRLVDLGINISDVGVAVGHPRSTVSQSIHHNRFPRVRRKVQEHLAL